MIKVNLLLARRKEKKVGVPRDILVLILCVALLLVVLGLVEWRMGKERDDTLARIAQTEREIADQKIKMDEVNKAKELQKTLEEKLRIINTLRKEKATSAKILDQVSIQKPEKLQLESLKKDGSKLGIQGIALDDETIANFMTNLRNSKLFKNVDLVVSEQIEQSKVKLKKFILSCEINLM
jgi:type IV pilus assembly protein PilN